MGAFGFAGQRFVAKKYYGYGGTGSGESYSNPAAILDADVYAIPAGTIIDRCYIIIHTAVTGTTVMEVGDDDDPNGFVVDIAASFATPGMYGWDAKAAGAYLRIQTAGVTDAADIYVVPNAKYYSAAGKEVKLNVTTAATAGLVSVWVEGLYIGH